MNWRNWFTVEFWEWPIAHVSSAHIEEMRYQKYKARMMEELQLPAPETPEERAKWIEQMVRKKDT